LYESLDSLIYWPEREELQKATPACFRKEFGTSITVVLDCFEVFAEYAAMLKAKGQMYSNYKSHSTVKVLIGEIKYKSTLFCFLNKIYSYFRYCPTWSNNFCFRAIWWKY
jgi:hypothetical protein